jgi:hypothetical protein
MPIFRIKNTKLDQQAMTILILRLTPTTPNGPTERFTHPLEESLA